MRQHYFRRVGKDTAEVGRVLTRRNYPARLPSVYFASCGHACGRPEGVYQTDIMYRCCQCGPISRLTRWCVFCSRRLSCPT